MRAPSASARVRARVPLRRPKGSAPSESSRLLRLSSDLSATNPAPRLATVPATATSPRLLLMSVTEVQTGNARADAAGDLVVDGPDGFCELLGRDVLLAVASHEGHDVAHLHVRHTDVHHELIHADRPGHPVTAPTDKHLGPSGEPSVVAVGVADRDRYDPTGVLELVVQSVRESVSGRKLFHHVDACLERHHRAEV